ncbi:MAG: alpha/beta hydrolase [Bacteroidetes bacterium]|nr:alpha/beta hydrolase [Bacteroidota bacterium]
MNSGLFKWFSKIHIIFILFLSIIILSGSFYAQDLEKVAGDWQGKLTVGEQKLTIIFHIDYANRQLTATLDSPDQGAYAIKVDNVTLQGRDLMMDIKSISGSFGGEINEKADEITGTWKQGTMSLPLNVSKQNNKIIAPEDIVFKEIWQGKLQVSGIELRLVIKIYNKEDGSLGAYLDSPDQGVKNINVSSVTKNDKELLLDIESIMGKYKGEYNSEANKIIGTWSQRGAEYPLTLEKTDKVEELKRPQNPTKPYPYYEEEVTFRNEEADISLAGTFTFPKNGGPFPAVVLVSGSGAQNRDEEIFEHKPFLIISDYLTRNGIAVLRYDDRGTAKSQGDFSSATTQDFMIDAISSVNYLSSRKEVDKSKIGMMGHSEGGLIAPMAAANCDELDFIIMLAGPGLPGRDILIMQNELISRANGESEDKIKEELQFNTKLYDLIYSDKDSPDLREKILQLINQNIEELPDSEKVNPMFSKENIERQVNIITSPWFKNFIVYDPRPTLENITIPVLALIGENDLQLPPKENIVEIRKALEKGGNKNFKIMELNKLNHLFQTSETGSVGEYGKLEETFSPEALAIIKDWILEITK